MEYPKMGDEISQSMETRINRDSSKMHNET